MDSNALTQEERQRIAAILQDISKQEDIFKNSLKTLQKLFLRIDAVDAKQIRELRERMGRVDETAIYTLRISLLSDAVSNTKTCDLQLMIRVLIHQPNYLCHESPHFPPLFIPGQGVRKAPLPPYFLLISNAA